MVFCPVNKADVGKGNVILAHHFREGMEGNGLGKGAFFSFFFLDFIWILQKETAVLFKPNLNGNIIYRRLQNAVDWGFSVCLHMMSPFNTCLCQAHICPRWPQRCSVAHAQLVVSPAQPLGSKDKAPSCVFTSWLCFLLPPN